MTSPEQRQGLVVQITREDKTSFLATTGTGEGPAIWTKSNRRLAISFADDLRKHGMHCEVVDVLFTDPVVIPKNGKGPR